MSPSEPTAPAPPACLAIHGLGGGPWELAPVVDSLRKSGISVDSITLPGHDHPGPRMPHSRYEDWMAAVEQAYDRLAAQFNQVGVIGFSTGATLGLWLASRRPVDRLVLLAPFLAIRHTWWLGTLATGWVRALARTCPDLPRRLPPVRDREARHRAAKLERYRTFSMPSTLSALELIAQVKPLVPSIQTPTLVLQGRRDSVVEPQGAEWLVRNLGSARKELDWLERSDHLLAYDADRTVLREAVVRFVLGE